MENSNPALPEKIVSYFIEYWTLQEDRYWCLVACVQNLLRYYGIEDIDQCDIVKYYVMHSSNPQIVEHKNKTANRGPENYFYMEYFKDNKEIYGLDIPTIERYVNKMLKESNVQLELKFICETKPYVIDYLHALLSEDCPALVPLVIDNNVHMNIVVCINENKTICFDPADKTLKPVDLSICASNTNLQILFAHKC